MSGLAATGTLALLFAACLGAGALILRALDILRELSTAERLVWCFSVGFAALGWALFFPAAAGALSPATLLAVCIAAALCGIAWRGAAPAPDQPNGMPEVPPGVVTALLLAALVVVLGVDFLEGLSPPAEADTLAYHFNLPKRYLEAGGLFLVPRAVDGTPPQLVHMTYMAALGLGGERALTLWTMATGWMTGALLFVTARRWLSRDWSLALALVYLSTPAILQTGGAGHVEPRLAPFVLIGALACAAAMRRDSIRHAGLAGLCAGAFAAGKYTGLLFGAACVPVLLWRPGRWRRLAAFVAAAAVAGFQWYLWTWLKTGDPLFPNLYGLLGVSDPSLWNPAQNAIYHNWVANTETAVPRTPWWLALYPFYATFVYNPVLENGRTGLGAFAFLVLPFAAGYVLKERLAACRGLLCPAAVIVVVFYVLWFFLVPQRVRHLVPVYPLGLLCLTVPAVRWATRAGVAAPLAAAAALCLGLQLAGQATFGLNYARHVFSGESRDAFLRRNVALYGIVPWINAHLGPGDRLLLFERQLLYFFDRRAYLSHPVLQARLNFATHRDDPGALYRELRAAGITHILDRGEVMPGTGRARPGHVALQRMVQAGCAREVHRQRARYITSRTVPALGTSMQWLFVFALTPETCTLVPGGSYPPATPEGHAASRPGQEMNPPE